MITPIKLERVKDKLYGKDYTTQTGREVCLSFMGGTKKYSDKDTGVGIRGLGRCGNPNGSWPLTCIAEETEEYIVACCDAGCAVILLKDPPIKKKKQEKRKSKLVKTLDGNLVPERKKTSEDNLLE